MHIENSIDIDAPASVVWSVFTDVEEWPTWTESMKKATALDGPVALGNAFTLWQPKLPPVKWVVTEFTEGESWTWSYLKPFNKTTASHKVVATGPNTTRVTQVISQTGLIGGTVGALMKNLSVRYMDAEAQGLKRASEEAHQRAAR